MKNRIMLLLTIPVMLLLVCTTTTLLSAHTVDKDAQGPTARDKSRAPVKPLPDLVVGIENQFSSQVIVRVTNKCKGKSAGSYVSMMLPDDKGANVFIGKNIKSLAPGESGLITFYIPKNLKLKSFENKWIRLVVDPQNKIKEASEGNNWWEPTAQPFPEKGGYCDPPYNG